MRERDPIDRVLTISQVAKLAGWSTSRMRRFLVHKHRVIGGALLVNVGQGERRPRWTITLRALQTVAPQWFADPMSTQTELDAIAECLADTREHVAAQGRRVTLAREKVDAVAREVQRAGLGRATIVRDPPLDRTVPQADDAK